MRGGIDLGFVIFISYAKRNRAEIDRDRALQRTAGT